MAQQNGQAAIDDIDLMFDSVEPAPDIDRMLDDLSSDDNEAGSASPKLSSSPPDIDRMLDDLSSDDGEASTSNTVVPDRTPNTLLGVDLEYISPPETQTLGKHAPGKALHSGHSLPASPQSSKVKLNAVVYISDVLTVKDSDGSGKEVR
jgi:hypothetical protein